MNGEGKQKGFVAITSVLIVSVLVFVLGISMFHSSMADQSMSVAHDNGQEASILADVCAREAFRKMKENIDYAGNETMEINGLSCTINVVENISASIKKISTSASVGEQPHLKRQEKEIRYVVESKAEDWLSQECDFENVELSGDSLVLSEELGEGEEAEAAARTTTSDDDWTGEGNYFSIDGLLSDSGDLVLEEGQTYGFRISNPLSLNEVKRAGSSLIEWTETVFPDTEISVYTKVIISEEMPVSAPETWNSAINGQPIPEIEGASDLTNHWLWVKQELRTDDPVLSPRLHKLSEKVTQSDIVPVKTEGYRVSPEFDISGAGNAKDSRIFWKADTRSDATIVVETRFYDGQEWTDWQISFNAREIPGIARGADLESAKIQTRVSFSGGPENYPALRSINIFIEAKK